MELIDKDALVAEIRKRLLPVIRDKHYNEWEEGKDSERIAILSIINTIEVKEVDPKDAFIEKACEWLKENFQFDEAGYCKTNIYSTDSMIYNFEKYIGGEL